MTAITLKPSYHPSSSSLNKRGKAPHQGCPHGWKDQRRSSKQREKKIVKNGVGQDEKTVAGVIEFREIKHRKTN